MATFLDDQNPFVIPTPSGNEASFGSWNIQWAISRGGFGTVYAVINAYTGKPAAAKHLLKAQRNQLDVSNEVMISEKIMELQHLRLACPIDIIRADRPMV